MSFTPLVEDVTMTGSNVSYEVPDDCWDLRMICPDGAFEVKFADGTPGFTVPQNTVFQMRTRSISGREIWLNGTNTHVVEVLTVTGGMDSN